MLDWCRENFMSGWVLAAISSDTWHVAHDVTVTFPTKFVIAIAVDVILAIIFIIAIVAIIFDILWVPLP